MGYLGTVSPQDVARMFPMIRARAWSRVNARHSVHGEGTLSGRVEVTRRFRAYADYFALDDYVLSHETFAGRMTRELKRAVFLASDAALVLPYDPRHDRVLLVEQMRMGPLARGDGSLWQLEPIAGRLDPGEAPQDAARREALEETGLALGALEAVAEAYCSPGNSSEFYYIYVGLADLPDRVAGTGGLDAEDEDIRSHVMSFKRLMDLCESRKVCNAPLVLAAYWLAHHRSRLRADAGVRDTGT
jgi:nudix-type nucleoside diphosphatase (YffH/AdpP family)